MSNYPDGMIRRNWRFIDGYPETTNQGKCDECGLKFDGLTFVWLDDEEGMSECPNCEAEIWIQAPEPDPDEWRERQREKAELDWWER